MTAPLPRDPQPRSGPKRVDWSSGGVNGGGSKEPVVAQRPVEPGLGRNDDGQRRIDGDACVGEFDARVWGVSWRIPGGREKWVKIVQRQPVMNTPSHSKAPAKRSLGRRRDRPPGQNAALVNFRTPAYPGLKQRLSFSFHKTLRCRGPPKNGGASTATSRNRSSGYEPVVSK